MVSKLFTYITLAIATATVSCTPLTKRAAPFEGQGKIVVVDHGERLGCLNEGGSFTVDTSACATFTGYRNYTANPEPWPGGTEYWYLNTDAGYCGAPYTSTSGKWDYILTCRENIKKEEDAYWMTRLGGNGNSGLTVLVFGKVNFEDRFTAVGAKLPTGKDAAPLRPFIGDAQYNPGGTKYSLTWDSL